MAFRIYGSGIPKDDEQAQQEAQRRRPVATPVELDQQQQQLANVVEDFRQQAALPFAQATCGNVFATVVVAKQLPASVNAVWTADSMLQAPDYQALMKALESMGYDPDDVLGVWVSQNGEAANGGKAVGDPVALRSLVELVDPVAVVALDAQASACVHLAFADCPPEAGDQEQQGSGEGFWWIAGRRHVFLDDFQRDLGSIQTKARAWAHLKKLKP